MSLTTLEPTLDEELDFDVAIQCNFKTDPPHTATHLIKLYKIPGWHPICWDCVLLLKKMERDLADDLCLNLYNSDGSLLAHYCLGDKVIQGIQEL